MRLVKAFLLVSICMGCIVTLSGVALLPSKIRATWRMRIVRLGSILVCKAFGASAEIVGPLPQRGQAHMLVANHLSYLDVALLGSVLPAVFVASTEVLAIKGIGRMSRLGGCLFVDRRRPTSLRHSLRQLQALFSQGLSAILFPEATSSNGESVLPFRSGLFAAAGTTVPIVPCAVRYLQVDGSPFGPSNRDKVAYYGDMEFMPHVWELLGCRRIRARLEFLPPLQVGHSDRRNLAARAREAVELAYFGGGADVRSNARVESVEAEKRHLHALHL